MTDDLVPLEGVQQAFVMSNLSACEVARRLGWTSGKGADASRVRRSLGLAPDRSGLGYVTMRQRAHPDLVQALAEAIGYRNDEAPLERGFEANG